MILGFSGFSKTGKDTAAVGLPGFTRVAFADALKEELAETLGITVEELETRKEEFRDAMVKLGAGRRAEDPRYWITKVEEKLVDISGNVAITDVRYANEALWIRSELGGRIIYLFRDGFQAANDEERRSIAEIWEHSLVDSVLQNNGTIENLHKRANDIRKYYEFCAADEVDDK